MRPPPQLLTFRLSFVLPLPSCNVAMCQVHRTKSTIVLFSSLTNVFGGIHGSLFFYALYPANNILKKGRMRRKDFSLFAASTKILRRASQQVSRRFQRLHNNFQTHADRAACTYSGYLDLIAPDLRAFGT